jgi:hypothetical protein
MLVEVVPRDRVPEHGFDQEALPLRPGPADTAAPTGSYGSPSGNGRAKRTHMGAQNGPTSVLEFTSLGRCFTTVSLPCSCSRGTFSLPSGRRVKRSRALRGRNPTRDSSADGAPRALQGRPRPRWWTGASLFPTLGHRSYASENPSVTPPAASPPVTRPSCPACSSSTPGSGSFRHSSPGCGSGASGGPTAPRSSAPPGTLGPTR